MTELTGQRVGCMLVTVMLLMASHPVGGREVLTAEIDAAAPSDELSFAQLRADRNPNQLIKRWVDDLPLLPLTCSPDSSTWSNSMAVCAIMKDEHVEDVVEWLQYYRWLGVDHVFLTDNGSKDTDAVTRRLQRTFGPAFLTMRLETEGNAQMKVYAWCAEEQRAHFNWLAFFDLDEILVLRDPSYTSGQRPDLKGYLGRFRHAAGLSVHWVMAGPSGHEKRPAGGGVLRAYSQCLLEPEHHVKTIVNTWWMKGVEVHPHNAVYRDGRLSVNEHGRPVPNTWRVKRGVKPSQCDEWSAQVDPPPEYERFCLEMTGAWDHDGKTVDNIALFHYVTKSRQDFEEKSSRGSGMGNHTRKWSFYEMMEREQVDAPLCREPAALWELCCSSNPSELLQPEVAAASSSEQVAVVPLLLMGSSGLLAISLAVAVFQCRRSQ